MRTVDLIIKKRNGESLNKEEINFLINGIVSKEIPDYQTSAYLMAVVFNGMENEELLHFTNAMLHSGEVVDLSSIKGVKCDKHSTGGVGDKTSLVVAPLAAACGVKMAKMSGRGLGHTGGTLDKIESIPGASINIDKDDFFNQVNDIGLAIIGQTADITPADKILYALRDVTGTVESIPLIASSIMSKKLASGADNIVLDVKVGSGAFMKDVETASRLAKTMVDIGNLAGRKTVATLTDMEEPLGDAIGNALEVIEAIETLKGKGPVDFKELCISLTEEILLVTGVCSTIEEAHQKTLDAISSGAGLKRLQDMIKYQHGNPDVINDYSLFAQAKETYEVFLNNKEGYVKHIDALAIGEAAMVLGAGRERKEDNVDPAVGIVLHKKVGDKVNLNESIATVYTNGLNTTDAINMIKNAYTITNEVVVKASKIIKVIR